MMEQERDISPMHFFGVFRHVLKKLGISGVYCKIGEIDGRTYASCQNVL